MTLTFLYLRTRRTGYALAALAVVALTGWLWQVLSRNSTGSSTFLHTFAPLAAATIIGASLYTPMGELEATASRVLLPLRLKHLLLLLIFAALSFAILDSMPVLLIRNLAGFTGLTLVSARIVGSSFAWIVPLCYGTLALLVGHDARWAWSMHVAPNGEAAVIAVALLLLGLGIIAPAGVPDRDTFS